MKFSLLITSTTLIVFLFSVTVFAHGVERSVDSIIQEIMSKQNVSKINEIDCNKVSDIEFEELGDALMERMAGSHELHEQMDTMMGGEGSESLRQMHIIMGENWLNCGNGQGMMGSMMSGGMMPMMMRMMGTYYPAYYVSYDVVLIFAIVGWILFVVLLIILVLTFTGTIRIKKRR